MPRVVVVGAGSAGCVLAARLSERPDVDVLLLEAGPDVRRAETPEAISGPSFVDAMAVPGRTWPDLVAQRTADQPARPYARGRGTGGSSAVNAMLALPGEPDDYDAWERDHGCTGWGWSSVAPWFARTALTLRRARPEEWGAVNRALAAAVPTAAEGVPLTRDDRGRRVSAADAYLEPTRGRANLRVRGGAHVDRVLFEGRRAAGVRLAAGVEVEADNVIVSAGAIHSPAILLRSGVDTPGVGDGLQDHPSFPIVIRRHEPAAPGTLAAATTAQLSSPQAHHDVQLLPLEHIDPRFPDLAALMAAVMHVHSRGRVRLTSTDAFDEPLVEFDMLADERDIDVMQEAIALADRVLEHPAWRDVGTPIPGDRSLAAIRERVGDYVHATGTCAMGRVVDTRANVIGYDGLVVCDASIMPQLPRATTHLPTVMVAERIAAWLREALDVN